MPPAEGPKVADSVADPEGPKVADPRGIYLPGQGSKAWLRFPWRLPRFPRIHETHRQGSVWLGDHGGITFAACDLCGWWKVFLKALEYRDVDYRWVLDAHAIYCTGLADPHINLTEQHAPPLIHESRRPTRPATDISMPFTDPSY